MNLFIDAEFNGFDGTLISIAIVPEDRSAPEFYCVVEGEWQGYPNAWVTLNVIPYLGPAQPLPREHAARAVANYLGERRLQTGQLPTLVADWPADFKHLLDLFMLETPGKMVGVTDFNMAFRSLRGFNAAELSEIPHNALSDARALRDYCEKLR